MNSAKNSISHKGAICEIDREKILVRIESESACATCHAKSFCNASDKQEKIVEVNDKNFKSYKVGEQVLVMMEKSLGMKAVLFSYLIPFVLLIIALIVALEVTGREGLSGIISLAVLVPYYLGLYMMKNRIKSTFEFRLRKIDESSLKR